MDVKYVWEDCLFHYNNAEQVCIPVVRLSEVDRVLAEKDREIAKWNELVGSFTQSQHKYMREMEKLKIAHQQLMEKAVRFAQSVVDYDPYHDGKLKKEARAFLEEREGT